MAGEWPTISPRRGTGPPCAAPALDAAQLARGRRGGRLRVVARSVSLYRWLRQLPTVTLALSDEPPGADIRRALRGRTRGLPRWWAVAVLELPTDPAGYLVGRHRQAVRTNRTRALREGYRVAEVTDPARIARHVAELSRAGLTDAYRGWLDRRGTHHDTRVWFVFDGAERCVGVAVVVVDRQVARLGLLKALDASDRSAVRYLLSAHILIQLGREGVRHVVVGSAIFVPAGLRYFQDRLGFSLANVRVRDLAPPPPALGEIDEADAALAMARR